MKSIWAVIAVSTAAVFASGCGWNVVEHGSDAGVDGGFDAGFDAGTGNISVYVVGDLTPKVFTDGYSGQTPSLQEFGIARLDLMTGPADPAPVTAFDHGASFAVIDMLSSTPMLAGRAPSAALPAATYSYGRVLMTIVRTTVNATAHSGTGFSFPGKLTVVSALSDAVYLGSQRAKGYTTYGFVPDGAGVSFSFPGPAPVLPSSSGGAFPSTDATRTWLVFPFSTPFVVSAGDSSPRSTTIHYEVFESFRWQDVQDAGYGAGAFDLDGPAMSAEPVKNFGATGYRTTTP